MQHDTRRLSSIVLIASVLAACARDTENATSLGDEDSESGVGSTTIDEGRATGGANATSTTAATRPTNTPGVAGSAAIGGSPSAGALGGTASGGSSSDGATSRGTSFAGAAPVAVDTDSDGVVDDRDLEPQTAPGTAVNSDGVSLTASSANPAGSANTITELPPSGTVSDNGFMTIVVGATSNAPMVFRTLSRNVSQLSNGFHVQGTLLVQTPIGQLPIVEADATFEGTSLSDIQRLRGRARVPFTDFGVKNAVIEAPSAEFGLDYGSNLASIQAPLNSDRKYLYFQFSDALKITAGPLTIEAKGGLSHTVVVDPQDPYFFVRADLSGIAKLGASLENVGIGVSRRGLIPFTPTNTWGIAQVPALQGHLYLDLSGSIKLPDLPISLDGSGDTVINLDPLGNGETIFLNPRSGIQLGANRELDISLSLIPDLASLSLEVGKATLRTDLLENSQTAYFSGVMYPGNSVLSEVVGIVPKNEIKVAGFVSQKLTDSYFDMAGDTTLELSKLSSLTGLKVSDIPLASATFHVAKDGVLVHGQAQASFLSSVGFDAQAQLDAKFEGDPKKTRDWYVNVNGDVTVAGVSLARGASQLTAAGLTLSGDWDSPLGQSVTMKGAITENSFLLSGTAKVTIPIATFDCTCNLPKLCDKAVYCEQARECSVAGTCDIANTCDVAKSCSLPRTCEIAKSCSVAKTCNVACTVTWDPSTWAGCFNSVTSAAVCGTTTIVDAAKCGTSRVTDAAKCGSDWVTSAAQCGTTSVTSAAQCGTSTVTDAVRCGTKVVRDAVRCGTDLVQCGVEQVTCGTIQATGAVCGAVCDSKISRELGEFVGSVSLTITESGLKGTVEGDYVAGGTTTHLVGGRVELTGTPKACITIPGGLGEFCSKF